MTPLRESRSVGPSDLWKSVVSCVLGVNDVEEDLPWENINPDLAP